MTMHSEQGDPYPCSEQEGPMIEDAMDCRVANQVARDHGRWHADTVDEAIRQQRELNRLSERLTLAQMRMILMRRAAWLMERQPEQAPLISRLVLSFVDSIDDLEPDRVELRGLDDDRYDIDPDDEEDDDENE